MKDMLADWELRFPGRVESIFSSVCNVSGSQLADPALFDFAGLEELRVSPAAEEHLTSAACETRVG